MGVDELTAVIRINPPQREWQLTLNPPQRGQDAHLALAHDGLTFHPACVQIPEATHTWANTRMTGSRYVGRRRHWRRGRRSPGTGWLSNRMAYFRL